MPRTNFREAQIFKTLYFFPTVASINLVLTPPRCFPELITGTFWTAAISAGGIQNNLDGKSIHRDLSKFTWAV